MENVLDVYTRPYDADYPVICMDESSKQHEAGKLENIPAKPGKIERFDTGYERNGTSNVLLSFEPLTGKRYIDISERRTRLDWAKHIRKLVQEWYPKAKKILLVCDNLNIHTGAALYELLPPQEAKNIVDRLEFHYTPKHGSWLNIAEIELSHLYRQCLNRRLKDMAEVKREVAAWLKSRNEEARIVDWRFTVNDARIKLKKLYPTISMNVKINETV
jgi:DDE superfamily endonuclease